MSSAMTALVLTPFDMVFFKMIAKSANLPPTASFYEVSQSVYVSRAGAFNAMGVAMAATFVRYFFFYTGINCFSN